MSTQALDELNIGDIFTHETGEVSIVIGHKPFEGVVVASLETFIVEIFRGWVRVTKDKKD